MKIQVFSGAIALAVSAAVAGETWTTDFSAAQKAAAEQKAPILAVFSGSDWCGPCMMLKSKVFDTPEFAAYAKGSFIPVELDYPRQKLQDEKTKKQNAELAGRYAISGFPTVLLLSPNGDVYGGFIGAHDQMKDVQKPIDAAMKVRAEFDEAMSRADAAEGTGKLKALADAYKAIPEEFRKYNRGLADRIIALDAQDTTGLKAERRKEEERQAKLKARNEALRAAAEKGPEAFRGRLEEMLKDQTDTETQAQLLPVLFQVQLSMAVNDAEFDAALATMDKMKAAVPQDAERIAQFRENIVKNKSKILENNKKRVEATKTASNAPKPGNPAPGK